MLDRRAFYDQRAAFRVRETVRYYQQLLRKQYAFWVPPGLRVLEVGCGLGDLLAAVKPARGVGVDFSPAMVALARQRHPELEFQVADAAAVGAETFSRTGRVVGEASRLSGGRLALDLGNAGETPEAAGETRAPPTEPPAFDYILLADLVNDLPDVQAAFERLRSVSQPRTRLVVTFFNNLWRPVLNLAAKLGLKSPTLMQNWLSADDVRNLLHLADWEVIKTETRILWPVRTPVWSWLCNRWLAPLLQPLCFTVGVIARPRPGQSPKSKVQSPKSKVQSAKGAGATAGSALAIADSPLPITNSPLPIGESLEGLRCSVIIPARNECGNIEEAVRRTPEMGQGTEILFIEGHSTDDTWGAIQRVAASYPLRNIKILKQQSRGKAGAVREAFAAATGDLLFILDADLTVPPEELPKFYEVLRSGKAEFVNGVRLVYPMEEQAMQFLNMVANKAFSLAFSWLLGQKIKDTLCGTKVLFRADYEAIVRNRAYFGEFDPFGDFDLLFGAAKLNLRLVDLPIRYRARTYGETNISRWSHGWLLLRMVGFAARRLKFIP